MFTIPPELQAACDLARANGVAYAGDVSPQLAWELFSGGLAQLVDVRSAEEHRFVGHVPGSQHVPWASGITLLRNEQFVSELRAQCDKSMPVLLLCRSGRRSIAAAEAATAAGFALAFNILEGFEGDRDAELQRGCINGWRRQGLPWVQD